MTLAFLAGFYLYGAANDGSSSCSSFYAALCFAFCSAILRSSACEMRRGAGFGGSSGSICVGSLLLKLFSAAWTVGCCTDGAGTGAGGGDCCIDYVNDVSTAGIRVYYG